MYGRFEVCWLGSEPVYFTSRRDAFLMARENLDKPGLAMIDRDPMRGMTQVWAVVGGKLVSISKR